MKHDKLQRTEAAFYQLLGKLNITATVTAQFQPNQEGYTVSFNDLDDSTQKKVSKIIRTSFPHDTEITPQTEKTITVNFNSEVHCALTPGVKRKFFLWVIDLEDESKLTTLSEGLMRKPSFDLLSKPSKLSDDESLRWSAFFNEHKVDSLELLTFKQLGGEIQLIGAIDGGHTQLLLITSEQNRFIAESIKSKLIGMKDCHLVDEDNDPFLISIPQTTENQTWEQQAKEKVSAMNESGALTKGFTTLTRYLGDFTKGMEGERPELRKPRNANATWVIHSNGPRLTKNGTKTNTNHKRAPFFLNQEEKEKYTKAQSMGMLHPNIKPYTVSGNLPYLLYPLTTDGTSGPYPSTHIRRITDYNNPFVQGSYGRPLELINNSHTAAKSWRASLIERKALFTSIQEMVLTSKDKSTRHQPKAEVLAHILRSGLSPCIGVYNRNSSTLGEAVKIAEFQRYHEASFPGNEQALTPPIVYIDKEKRRCTLSGLDVIQSIQVSNANKKFMLALYLRRHFNLSVKNSCFLDFLQKIKPNLDARIFTSHITTLFWLIRHKLIELNSALFSELTKENERTHVIHQLLEINIPVRKLLDIGATTKKELITAGVSIEKLYAAGVTIQELIDVGTTVEELVTAKIPLTELRQAGITAQELLDAQVSIKELYTAGVTIQDLFDTGTTVEQLVKAKIPLTELRQAGITIQQLLNAQAPINKLYNAGITTAELHQAGASIRNITIALNPQRRLQLKTFLEASSGDVNKQLRLGFLLHLGREGLTQLLAGCPTGWFSDFRTEFMEAYKIIRGNHEYARKKLSTNIFAPTKYDKLAAVDRLLENRPIALSSGLLMTIDRVTRGGTCSRMSQQGIYSSRHWRAYSCHIPRGPQASY